MAAPVVVRPECDILGHLLDKRLRRTGARGDADEVEVALRDARAGRLLLPLSLSPPLPLPLPWSLSLPRSRDPGQSVRVVDAHGCPDRPGVPIDRHQRQDLVLAELALD